jgi:hypothetical protein
LFAIVAGGGRQLCSQAQGSHLGSSPVPFRVRFLNPLSAWLLNELALHDMVSEVFTSVIGNSTAISTRNSIPRLPCVCCNNAFTGEEKKALCCASHVHVVDLWCVAMDL